ncbi:hypothetical protein evm_012937 [Chilo suppressalis]|nr:hypothetical protein evm_012937 [Chilo suppressalis]
MLVIGGADSSYNQSFFMVMCMEAPESTNQLSLLMLLNDAEKTATYPEGRVEPPPVLATTTGFLPQTLADHIGKLVNEKFNDVMRGDLVHSKRKVLAGIVITTNNRVEGAKVIAVTTGTKCVSGEHMSVRGRVLNDCHAEVAARRCLQRHLYAQLLMYASSLGE